MVSKAKLKLYGFNDLDSYFRLIVSSEEKGNLWQTRGLYKDMSKNQRVNFFKWYKKTHKVYRLGMTLADVEQSIFKYTKKKRRPRVVSLSKDLKVSDITVGQLLSLLKAGA
jgi:hypothetical protein